MTQLKPCPFCKGTDISVMKSSAIGVVPDWANVKHFYYTRCEICGARGPQGETSEKAAEQWNTRPEVDALQAETLELRLKLALSDDALTESIKSDGRNLYETKMAWAEVERLQAENARLRAENAGLLEDVNAWHSKAVEYKTELNAIETEEK